MQETSGEDHGAQAGVKALRPVGRGRIARRIRASAVFLVIAGYIATIVVAIKVPVDAQVLPDAILGFLVLALVTLTLLVIMLVRVIRRVGAIARSALPAEQHGIRPWAVDGALAAAVFLGIVWMTAVIDNGGYDQRCIDSETMTVVAASNCESSGSQGGSSGTVGGGYVYEWYYGGTGNQIGDYVQGGSLTEPGIDDGGGSGGGGGSSGGDDGGDGSDGGDGGDGGGGGE